MIEVLRIFTRSFVWLSKRI